MKRQIAVLVFCFLAASLFAADNRWSSNGPYGGYFLQIAFDPQSTSTLYVSGGDRLYRSRNNGQTYERLDISGADGFPGAFTVRFQPGSSSRMVAAGISIFDSTNQGTNWQEIAHTPAGGDQFYDLEFDPSNGQIVYAVSYRKGVFRSNDGGHTWTAKNSGLNINPKASCCDFPQLEVDPSNPATVYVLLASRTLYKSTNGGDSWKALSGLKLPSQVNSLSVDSRNSQNVYAGGFDGIFKSTNGGTSWSDTNCCGIFSLAIDPKNTQTLYAVTDSAFKSTNGGGTWARLPAPIADNGAWLGIAVHPRSNALFAGGFGTGIYRSLDGGRGWKEFLSKLDGLYVENVQSSAQKPALVFSTQAPVLFSSSNTANSWIVNKSLRVSPRALAIHPANSNLVAAAGETNGFAISSDGGRTWSTRGPFSNVREFCTDCVQFHPQDQNTIYLAPLGVGMARSTDRGASWNTINSGLTDKNISVIAVDPSNGSNLFVGTTAGKVFRSTNGGGAWKSGNSGIANGYALAILVDPRNSNIAYAAVDRQPDKAFVYKTTNAGQSWTQKSRGLDSRFAIRGFTIDPTDSNTLFAAGEAGIFVTGDGGENWSPFDSTGLSQFFLFDVRINPADPNTLLLATDRGVFSYTRKTSSPGSALINGIVPSSAKVGDTVVIQGHDFGASQGSGSIAFTGASGGTAASWSDSAISVRVPTGAQTGPLILTVNGRRSNSYGFQVLASSGNIEPASGPSGGGTPVTILGPAPTSRFLLTVQFGNTLAKNVRFTPPNIYTCSSPPGNGTVDVRIVSGGSVTNAGTFRYQ